MITEQKQECGTRALLLRCYDTQKTDDGNHLNWVSHWQNTLKKIHEITLAVRLV